MVEALGSAFAILSVGGALAAALVTAFVNARLFGRAIAWPLGSFLSTVDLLFVGFEIAVAEKLRR